MEFLLFSTSILAIFLFALLLTAGCIYVCYRDHSALYKLFAVRDKLIDTVVFDGMPRDDPWFEAIYLSVNNILQYSHELSGPLRWQEAKKRGERMGRDPSYGESCFERVKSDNAPPIQLDPIVSELVEALDHLIKNHRGWGTQITAQTKAVRQVREKESKAERRKLAQARASMLKQQREAARKLKIDLTLAFPLALAA